MSNNDIGKKIRERRLQLGMTQAELGQKLRIGRSTICKYEKGVLSNLQMETQKRIAEALKMDVTELFATDYRFFTVSGDDFADLVSGGMDPEEAMAEYDRRVQYYGKKMMQLDYKQRDMIEGMIDELLKTRE